MFTQIIAAGFDVLTYFKGSWARSASEAFTTVDYQSPDGTAHKFDEAFKDHPRKGYLGLQDHGSPCWYKNIKLKELP